MIDTDKIMRITKILLHGRHINKNEADDYLELIAEVKRLRKGIKEAIQHLTYPAKYDREVEEQTDKLKELIG